MSVPPRLILASGSPRRRELLELVGVPHLVSPAALDELRLDGEPPAEFARRAAADKALAVARSHHRGGLPVLGADTVVEIDGAVLGKPESAADARRMLGRLAGRIHQVHTGMALAFGGRVEALVDTARVRFHPLDERQISWYVATGEPMDKAGAYAVQGAGGLLVAAVDGSPHTVIGLTIGRLPELFAAHGLDFWGMVAGAG